MQIEKGFRVNMRLAWLVGILACLLVVFAFYYIRQAAKTVTATISNTEPRRDVTGQIIDAHRGCLQLFNGIFYLYGTAFGTNQDGAAEGLTFVVYSSPDLQKWTYAGKLLKDPPDGFYSRAFIVFNPTTRKYVAWYSWFPKLWNGQAGIAVSDTPTGPFVVVRPKAHLIGKRPGDGSLFVDDDGTGYYIYTDMQEGYALRVEQLTPDFLDTDGKSSNIMAEGSEAPVLFRRKNIYYALCGPLCPDCPEGSEVQVFTSDSPLGPFSTKLSLNINHRDVNDAADSSAASDTFTNRPGNAFPTESTSGSNGSMVLINRATSNPNIPVQETWVLKLPAGDDSDYVWIADRWGSAPDGVKAHDLQYWSPLQFSDDGQILPLKKVRKWNISFTADE
jgi:hypothetical protein